MRRSVYPALILLCALISGHAHSQLEISKLTGDFYIYTTYQQVGEQMFPANGMYVVTNKGVVMIDTPWDTAQFQPLLDSIKLRHDKEVVLCIPTHWHEDRTGGLGFLRDQGVMTFSSEQTSNLCQKEGKTQAEFVFKKDTTFNLGEYSFQTLHPGEGHTVDNIVIWFGKERILYGGCLVKSYEATNLGYTAEANLETWPGAIKNLQERFENPAFVIPGHQKWDKPGALENTLRLLDQ